MGLTKAQATIWQKARSLGNGAQAVGLPNECCAYLVGRIVQDLGLVDQYSEFAQPLPSFFSSEPLENLVATGLDVKVFFERLVTFRRTSRMLRASPSPRVRSKCFVL